MNHQVSAESIRPIIIKLMADGKKRTADEIVSIVSKEEALPPALVNQCMKAMSHSSRFFKRFGPPANVKYVLQKDQYPKNTESETLSKDSSASQPDWKSVGNQSEIKITTATPGNSNAYIDGLERVAEAWVDGMKPTSPGIAPASFGEELEKIQKAKADPSAFIFDPKKDRVELAIYKVLAQGGEYTTNELRVLLEDTEIFALSSIGSTLSAVISSPSPWVVRRPNDKTKGYLYSIAEDVVLVGDYPMVKKNENKTEAQQSETSSLENTMSENTAPLFQATVKIRGVEVTIKELVQLQEYFVKVLSSDSMMKDKPEWPAFVEPCFMVKGQLIRLEEVKQLVGELAKM